MTLFKPCIDLHEGRVKQIIGSTLSEKKSELETNFTSSFSAGHYAMLYKNSGLKGGHVIKLGPGNDEAAKEALSIYPGNLQIGGGIVLKNASSWLEAGASHVIVTSWLFDSRGHFIENHLAALVREIGKERIVIDLSCRAVEEGWVVAMNRWQTLTDLNLDLETLNSLSAYCDEFLIHAADVEGKCEGIDERLVTMLGNHQRVNITYAGGAHSLEDLRHVSDLSSGRVDLTIGSALDIFGGKGVTFEECVKWNLQAAK